MANPSREHRAKELAKLQEHAKAQEGHALFQLQIRATGIVRDPEPGKPVPPENKAEVVDLEGKTKAELAELAAARGVTVVRDDGTTGTPRKADYIRALR